MLFLTVVLDFEVVDFFAEEPVVVLVEVALFVEDVFFFGDVVFLKPLANVPSECLFCVRAVLDLVAESDLEVLFGDAPLDAVLLAVLFLAVDLFVVLLFDSVLDDFLETMLISIVTGYLNHSVDNHINK